MFTREQLLEEVWGFDYFGDSRTVDVHVKRLRDGECTIELGFVFADFITNFERVSDHCSNIAVCLIEIENNSFDTHEYLSNVKETGANEFFEYYDMYKQRYSL